jgi:hypothetical protein
MIGGFEPVLDIGMDSTKRMKRDEGINMNESGKKARRVHASQRDDMARAKRHEDRLKSGQRTWVVVHDERRVMVRRGEI